jgi:hypothetical protein
MELADLGHVAFSYEPQPGVFTNDNLAFDDRYLLVEL